LALPPSGRHDRDGRLLDWYDVPHALHGEHRRSLEADELPAMRRARLDSA